MDIVRLSGTGTGKGRKVTRWLAVWKAFCFRCHPHSLGQLPPSDILVENSWQMHSAPEGLFQLVTPFESTFCTQLPPLLPLPHLLTRRKRRKYHNSYPVLFLVSANSLWYIRFLYVCCWKRITNHPGISLCNLFVVFFHYTQIMHLSLRWLGFSLKAHPQYIPVLFEQNSLTMHLILCPLAVSPTVLPPQPRTSQLTDRQWMNEWAGRRLLKIKASKIMLVPL